MRLPINPRGILRDAILAMVVAVVGCIGAAPSSAAETPRPNIVYILCDDLGYGDVKCMNPDGKIATPHVDALAADGMIFADAHSSSSVCSPTRYGILTGRYNWRSRLQSGVLGGYSPPLIEPGRLTVPALLQQHGYHTACIGKWHLGMDMALKADAKRPGDGIAYTGWMIDYAKPIGRGPIAVGFDEYFGISASLDMDPFVFIENDRFAKVPTVEKKFVRNGPAADDFEAVDVLPRLTARAVDYIGRRSAEAKSGKPFFLYLPFSAPHGPIVPTPQWAGRSGINAYADFVMQTDDCVGQVLKAIDDGGITENTLVIFTSDNGCSPVANIPELLAKGHNPNYLFRGHKADIWDGGHHIPFIARWPGHVKPSSRSDQLICLTDLMATVADLLDQKLPPTAGEDSVSLLRALLGKDKTPLREAVVHHSITGMFAIRQGQWKLELCAGSGGWSDPKDPAAVRQGLPPVQLYDMANDIGEKNNVQSANPEIVQRLTKLLEKYVAEGRSTPGTPQKNTVEPNLWKKPPLKKPDGD